MWLIRRQNQCDSEENPTGPPWEHYGGLDQPLAVFRRAAMWSQTTDYFSWWRWLQGKFLSHSLKTAFRSPACTGAPAYNPSNCEREEGTDRSWSFTGQLAWPKQQSSRPSQMKGRKCPRTETQGCPLALTGTLHTLIKHSHMYTPKNTHQETHTNTHPEESKERQTIKQQITPLLNLHSSS